MGLGDYGTMGVVKEFELWLNRSILFKNVFDLLLSLIWSLP